jgi:hypothetical protein
VLLALVLAVSSAFTAVPPSASAAQPLPRLLFGLGPEADTARHSPLTQQAPVHMLTSWYNGPSDLSWIKPWRTSEVPSAYAAGYALHLIVYTNSREQAVSTRYGRACGRVYPLTSRFLGDVKALAQTFAGRRNGPPLYVTMFTEFQTYACVDNQWAPKGTRTVPAGEVTNYYEALRDQYLRAMAVFHRDAPNARVSIGWGGWQARWDQPATGGGRSMFEHFAALMRASDFESFQAMSNDSNAGDVLAMTRILGQYGPVMLAHYQPDNDSVSTFSRDMHTIMTRDFLTRLRANRLFAMSFMKDTTIRSSASLYQFVKNAVITYGR